MANNLTQHLRVVGAEQAGIQPQPGWFLVVLKQVGTGRIPHAVLQPGQRSTESNPVTRAFTRTSNLVSIPVTTDSNLRHEFTSSIQHVSPGHSFEADYVMGFAVASPEKVAVRWLDDPIRKIEDEIKRVLDPAARTEKWDDLRDQILEDGAVALYREVVQDSLERELLSFAHEYGVEIKSLRMSLRLSRTDAQPDADAAELSRRELTVQIDTAKKRAELKAGHELKRLEVIHKAELRALERPGELMDAGLDATKKAMDRVADATHKSEDLVRAVRDVTNVMVSPLADTSALGSGSAPPIGLPPGPAPSDNKVLALVQEVCATVDSLQGDSARKTELLSASLHLVAEACGEGATSENAKALQARVRELVSAWSDLEAAQFKTLNKLSDLTLLRERAREGRGEPVADATHKSEDLIQVVEVETKEAAWSIVDTPGLGSASGPQMPIVNGSPGLRFSCRYPKELPHSVWATVLAYVYLPRADKLVNEDARQRLGLRTRDYAESKSHATVSIARGAEIVAVPDFPGVRFNPPKASIIWFEDWHSFEFRVSAEGLPDGSEATGAIKFYVGPIQISEIAISIRQIGETEPIDSVHPDTWADGTFYQAIFVSYSHEDEAIVDRLEQAYQVLGMDFLRDSKILRSGVAWKETLLKKIEEADIFQLCWSSRARDSKWVQEEWKHALSLNRPRFVRPLYWEKPMPRPPAELDAIHFAYLSW